MDITTQQVLGDYFIHIRHPILWTWMQLDRSTRRQVRKRGKIYWSNHVLRLGELQPTEILSLRTSQLLYLNYHRDSYEAYCHPSPRLRKLLSQSPRFQQSICEGEDLESFFAFLTEKGDLSILAKWFNLCPFQSAGGRREDLAKRDLVVESITYTLGLTRSYEVIQHFLESASRFDELLRLGALKGAAHSGEYKVFLKITAEVDGEMPNRLSTARYFDRIMGELLCETTHPKVLAFLEDCLVYTYTKGHRSDPIPGLYHYCEHLRRKGLDIHPKLKLSRGILHSWIWGETKLESPERFLRYLQRQGCELETSPTACRSIPIKLVRLIFWIRAETHPRNELISLLRDGTYSNLRCKFYQRHLPLLNAEERHDLLISYLANNSLRGQERILPMLMKYNSSAPTTEEIIKLLRRYDDPPTGAVSFSTVQLFHSLVDTCLQHDLVITERELVEGWMAMMVDHPKVVAELQRDLDNRAKYSNIDAR